MLIVHVGENEALNYRKNRSKRDCYYITRNSGWWGLWKQNQTSHFTIKINSDKLLSRPAVTELKTLVDGICGKKSDESFHNHNQFIYAYKWTFIIHYVMVTCEALSCVEILRVFL